MSCRADSTGADWFTCARGTVGCPRIHDDRTPHCTGCLAGDCRFAHDPPAVEMSWAEYKAAYPELAEDIR